MSCLRVRSIYSPQPPPCQPCLRFNPPRPGSPLPPFNWPRRFRGSSFTSAPGQFTVHSRPERTAGRPFALCRLSRSAQASAFTDYFITADSSAAATATVAVVVGTGITAAPPPHSGFNWSSRRPSRAAGDRLQARAGFWRTEPARTRP